VSIRIGSNYNKYAKNIYVDLGKKCILYVPSEPKITFMQKNNNENVNKF
jgi:hypothetical protein